MAGVNLHKAIRGKIAGLRSNRGQPDLTIYQMCRGYGGLLLELKAEGTRILKVDGRTLRSNAHLNEQASTLANLGARGYLATFAVGFDEAKDIINWYLTDNVMTFPGTNYLISKGIFYAK